ncbi:FAD-dependent oxidoreductase [Sulfitobacter aestuariivivens]|uniref:FAD-dependent oxidoreductase n=1 Tax=Sulfitobacter aestuariivivens TaxID=2766981 RepID=UPI0036207D69
MAVETRHVVIIGGGVVGCAALYHLARRGLTDAVLLERQELTAGSSWHAAGNLAALTMPSNAATLQKQTIEHYAELEEFSGQSCGVHIVGGLYLSRGQDQTYQLRRMDSQARRSGVETRFITAQDAREMVPVLDTDGIDSILYEPLKGYCDPASVTHAYAKAARKMGAEVRRFMPVEATRPLADGGWEVVTPKGVIHADVLINAAGLWGREVAALAGLSLPLMPVEHHYFVTEPMPALAALPREIAHVSEPGGGYYLRQEGQGLLLGIYEDACTLWSEAGTPLDFGHELLPDDLSRAEKAMDHVMRAIPAMAEAGIKRVVNGPMILTPDLAPLVGPHPGARNYFCANGVMSGFNQGGGIGRILAEWIVDGEPSMDVHFWDVARFGDWADADYTAARVRYGYEHRQKVYYPHEEVDVARRKVTSAVYDTLSARGAVHGAVYGMEHPLWYAPEARQHRITMTLSAATGLKP